MKIAWLLRQQLMFYESKVMKTTQPGRGAYSIPRSRLCQTPSIIGYPMGRILLVIRQLVIRLDIVKVQ